EWNGPKENNIFAVNSSMQTQGIAEPHLSLMALRSARILNRALGRDLFYLSMPPSLIQWRSVSREKPQPEAASLTLYT
ncbi:lysine 6-monooxygenase, partial [Klebsiella pneumoniae]|nr:lysine 6-monooxygenase [Klebsiella pneumoniae]